MATPQLQRIEPKPFIAHTDSSAKGPDRSIIFDDGLPGFPEACRFELQMLEQSHPALMSLRSSDDAALSFVVYAFNTFEGLYRPIEIDAIEATMKCKVMDCALLGMLTLTAGPDGIEAFVNLRAPIVIEVATRRGMQIVLTDRRLPFRRSIGRVADNAFPKSPLS